MIPNLNWTKIEKKIQINPHLDHEMTIHILLVDSACRCFDFGCFDFSGFFQKRPNHATSSNHLKTKTLSSLNQFKRSKHQDNCLHLHFLEINHDKPQKNSKEVRKKVTFQNPFLQRKCMSKFDKKTPTLPHMYSNTISSRTMGIICNQFSEHPMQFFPSTPNILTHENWYTLTQKLKKEHLF